MKRILALLMALLLLSTAAACRKNPTTEYLSTASDEYYWEYEDVEGADGEEASTDATTSDKEDGKDSSKDSNTANKGNSSKKPSSSKNSSTNKTSSSSNGFSEGSTAGKVVQDEIEIPNLPKLSSKVKNKTVRYLSHVNASSTDKSITSRYLTQYGITVEYITVPYENKRTKLVQMIAAGDAPDLISMDEAYMTLLTNDLCQPIEKYFDFSDKIWDSVRDLMADRKYKGKTYEAILHATPSRMFFYNAKLFKEAALNDPLYYYNKGEWDWDKMIDLAKKMTKDLNNDGVIDQWGFGGESLQFMVMGAVNEAFVTVDSNGKVKNNLRSEKLAKAMNMFKDLQNTYKIFSASSGFGDIVKGKLAMGYFGNWSISTVEGAKEQWDKGNLCYVPSPSAPGMKNYNFPLYESMFIPVGAKNPHGAAAFVVYLKYAEASGTSSDPANMQKVYKDACKNLMTSATNRDFSSVASMEWGICGDLKNGKSWSSIVEEYAPKLDASIAQMN